VISRLLRRPARRLIALITAGMSSTQCHVDKRVRGFGAGAVLAAGGGRVFSGE